MSTAAASEEGLDRRVATLFIAPFLLLGVGNVILILFWGVNPLWGFLILPPILFISVIGWIGFRTGFIRNVGEE
ncbi:hypothetical protein GJ629_06200 [Halapricum sp. CBA1109]|jgi:hypothetical protein|uniref:hypothetical protein n=1 Tax=Halapricum sp. CBA1109 TaxID=2668068 RepID=UPI0012F9DF04|nr:hypothetical protein [Halapricum sp. CBA1109]MUV89538.1 hypothetical protein [Halapricum sp. CBA1109]